MADTSFGYAMYWQGGKRAKGAGCYRREEIWVSNAVLISIDTASIIWQSILSIRGVSRNFGEHSCGRDNETRVGANNGMVGVFNLGDGMYL